MVEWPITVQQRAAQARLERCKPLHRLQCDFAESAHLLDLLRAEQSAVLVDGVAQLRSRRPDVLRTHTGIA